MHAFGWAYFGLGAYDDAEQWLRDSLRLRQDPASRSAAEDLVLNKLHLAATLRASGREDEATRLRAEAWETLDHGDVDDLRLAKRLNELAFRLKSRGDLESALDGFTEAVTMKRRLLVKDDASIAIALNNLAATQEALGRYDESESSYRESLRIKKKLAGADPQYLERTQNNLAALLRDQGLRRPERRAQLWAEADELFRKSLETRRTSYGSDDRRVAVVLNNLALLQIYRGDLTEAETSIDEALKIFRTERGPRDNTVGVVLRNRATLLQAQGKFEEAVLNAQLATEILVEALDPGHWRTADARSVLGACLLDLNRVGDAEPLLRDSLPILEAELGKDARATWEARQRLQRYQSLASGEAPSTGD
jgi:tetratricopeptide (TPR) repeat protein